jgi:probable nitrogen fixation protein
VTPPAPFARDLAALVRAGDPYGRLDDVPTERLLRSFVVAPAAGGADGAVACAVDARTVERLRCFHQAVAAGVERAAKVMTSVVVDVNGEGFGLVVVLAGRLAVLVRPVRDAGGFGFPDPEALIAAGDRLVAQALETLDHHPEVARADD